MIKAITQMISKFKTASLLAICLVLLQAASAQCPPGDVNLTTQAEVDAFVAAYPTCTTIAGNLLIGVSSGASDIDDISGLFPLVNIQGNFTISKNPDLISFIGLQSISTITGYLAIVDNSGLLSMNGLGSVDDIGGSLFINNNDALTTFSSIGSIGAVGGLLRVAGNAQLQNVAGLSGITSLAGNIDINNNPAMTSLNGLQNLASIGAGIEIKTNASLIDISALANLQTINGQIFFIGNSTLTNLTGLGNIGYTGITSLVLLTNSNLSTCDVLSICNYLDNGGSSTITGNATGCNSAAEIQTECDNPCPMGQEVLVSGTGCVAGSNPVDGYYPLGGTANGKNYYAHASGVWYIVWVPSFNPPAWTIGAISGNQSEIQYWNATDSPKPPADGWNNLGNYCSGLPNPTLCGDVNEIASWTGPSSGNWNSSSNWSNNSVPGTNSIVTIPNNVTVTISSAASAYSVEVQGGSGLVVNGQLTLTSGEAVSLSNSTSTVSGTGTINGNLVNSNGQAQPGNSPGKLTINGNYDNSAGTTSMEINGTTAETQYDVLDVTGTATISGASKLHLTFGYNPAVNDFYDLITANTVTGTYSGSNITLSGGNVSTVSLSYPGSNKVRVTVTALLPVELLDFSATPSESSVLLTWRTASETNNEGFEVKRSSDGRNWDVLAFVPGHGTSLETHSYSHTDRQPMPGVNYYRLRQMDWDGRFEYSQMVSVRMGQQAIPFFIAPNPNRGTFSLHLENPLGRAVTACLVDSWGREVWTLPPSPATPDAVISIGAQGALPGGIYTLRLTLGSDVFFEKIMVR